MPTFYEAALRADSLSLGPHWIYDQEKIAARFPHGVTTPAAPMSEYHPGKKAGDRTHYGDQMKMLKASLEKRDGFDPEGWREDWLTGMKDFGGYLDGAGKETLASDGRKPSDSSDLGGAARIAPILDLGLPVEVTVAAVRAQTSLTHGDPAVADAAEFFARAVPGMKGDVDLECALKKAAQTGDYGKLPVGKHLDAALARRNDAPLVVAKDFGQACGVENAFPLALYFALRPGTDFKDAISENALAGGDSSARGMLIALIFAEDPAAKERSVR